MLRFFPFMGLGSSVHCTSTLCIWNKIDAYIILMEEGRWSINYTASEQCQRDVEMGP